MFQRSIAALGVAGAGIALVGLLAPNAAADVTQWQTVAPGVQCIGTLCKNDNNQTYRVDWVAHCINPGTSVPSTTVAAQTWVGAHEEVALTAACPTAQRNGTWVQDPPRRLPGGVHVRPAPRWQPGDFVAGAFLAAQQFNRAVPDGSRRPGPPVGSLQQLMSGSAG